MLFCNVPSTALNLYKTSTLDFMDVTHVRRGWYVLPPGICIQYT